MPLGAARWLGTTVALMVPILATPALRPYSRILQAEGSLGSTSGDAKLLFAVTCCPKAPGRAAGATHTLSQQLPGGVAGSEWPQRLLGVSKSPLQLPLLSAPQPPSLKTTCTSSWAHVLLCLVSSIIAKRDVTQVETCPLCPRLRGAFGISLGPSPSPKGPLVASAPKPENSEKLVL